MVTKVIQLCEATNYCTRNATALATFSNKGKVASRPVACCDEHKSLAEEKAEHYRVSVTFRSIAEQATS